VLLPVLTESDGRTGGVNAGSRRVKVLVSLIGLIGCEPSTKRPRRGLTRPERAEVTRHKGGAGQLGFPGLHDLFGLFRRNLFQHPFDTLARAGVLESLHDRRRGEVCTGSAKKDK